MIHRRGVAVADRAVLGPDADDPAFRRRVRGEREFPVLVFFREDRFLDAYSTIFICVRSRSCLCLRAGARPAREFHRHSAAVAAWCCGSRSPARSMRGSTSSRIARKIVHIVDHPQRQSIEAGAAQALHRFHRIVIAADARKAGAADQAGLELVLVGLEPGVDARAAQIEGVFRRLPVALLVDDVVMVVLRLLAGAARPSGGSWRRCCATVRRGAASRKNLSFDCRSSCVGGTVVNRQSALRAAKSRPVSELPALTRIGRLPHHGFGLPSTAFSL